MDYSSSSSNLNNSKNIAFSTITLNLKELTPNFPSLANNNAHSARNCSSKNGFSSTRAISRNNHYDRSPSRNNPYEPPGSAKELTFDRGDTKDVPLMNILKKLHKDKMNTGSSENLMPNQLMNGSVAEMKFNFLKQAKQ